MAIFRKATHIYKPDMKLVTVAVPMGMPPEKAVTLKTPFKAVAAPESKVTVTPGK